MPINLNLKTPIKVCICSQEVSIKKVAKTQDIETIRNDCNGEDIQIQPDQEMLFLDFQSSGKTSN